MPDKLVIPPTPKEQAKRTAKRLQSHQNKLDTWESLTQKQQFDTLHALVVDLKTVVEQLTGNV